MIYLPMGRIFVHQGIGAQSIILKYSLLLFSLGFRNELFLINFESCFNTNWVLWVFSFLLSGIIV